MGKHTSFLTFIADFHCQISLHIRGVMICIITKYFSLNKILLLALGLWPYNQSNFVRFQIVLILSILTSSIIFQLTTFLTAECTRFVIIKVLSVTIFSTIYIIKYNSFWINSANVKLLLERLQEICNELKDENEINIMEEYGNNTKRYTGVIIFLTICSLFIMYITPVLMPMLSIILHINKSEPYQMLYFMTEYFIDQEKYSYLILLHINIAIFIGATTVTATGTMLRGCLIHACGMFKIASYRIEQAMKMFENVNIKNEFTIYKEIGYAIDIHHKAMKYAEFLLSSFQGSFFLIILICVISLSLNLFSIFQTASLGNNQECVLHVVILSVFFLYMFLVNYVGQEIADHNNYVHTTAYNVGWYVAPIHTQKLILFILQKGSKVFVLNVGKLFGVSLECFAVLIKASMSYFTFMYSMQ
ncbi:hypothetical protein P5V15_008190 [Pogonomyrmex californicus]